MPVEKFGKQSFFYVTATLLGQRNSSRQLDLFWCEWSLNKRRLRTLILVTFAADKADGRRPPSTFPRQLNVILPSFITFMSLRRHCSDPAIQTRTKGFGKEC